MSQPSITFTRIAELYVQELRTGAAPQMDEYIRAFPQLATEIQLHFPTLRIMESAHIPLELKPGDTLGGCVIENEIGRGGMGIVYCAHDQVNDRKVAVKVLPLNNTTGRDTQRFQHEREAMSRLNHPNIVPVYSHGCNEDFAFLVIKLIDGHNLSQLLKNEAGYRSILVLSQLRNDWCAFAEMASQLASGLQHAHDNGLVHRDIKPANLLLDRTGKIWISDFGLAKLWDAPHSVSLTGDVIGTPRYMAPEQSQGICDARSDIFSLGATLYELASGQRASQGDTFGSIIRHRGINVCDIRKACPNVPDELAKIIMRACQYDPGNRYQTAREMQFVLERYFQGFAKADRRDSKRPSDELYKQRTRRNVRLAIAAGGCICVLTLAYPAFMRTQSRGPKKSIAMRELELPTQKLIDQLAVGKQDDVVEVVSDVFQKSIERHGTAQWNYSAKAKQDLLDRANVIKQLFVENQLNPAHMNKFMNLYRSSSFAVAGRLLHLIPQVEYHIKDAREQARSFENLKRFSSAIINQTIDKTEANRFIDSLVRGRFNSIEESTSMHVPADELTQWLAALQLMIDKLPAERVKAHAGVPQELEQMFTEAFGVDFRSRSRAK